MIVNNLPLLFQIKYDSMTGASSIGYKVPVAPLSELLNSAIRFSLTRASKMI